MQALMGWTCSKKMIMRFITLIMIILSYLSLASRKNERIDHNLDHNNEIFISQLCLIASTVSIFMELGYDFLFNKTVAPKAYSLERLLIVSGYLLQYRTRILPKTSNYNRPFPRPIYSQHCTGWSSLHLATLSCTCCGKTP